MLKYYQIFNLQLLCIVLNLLAVTFGSAFDPVDFSMADAQPNEIKYRLLNREDPTVGKYYSVDSVPQLGEDLPTKLLIHGFTTNERSPWYEPMKKAFLDKEQCNVIYVDWNIAGNKSYEISAANSKPVGKFIAEFLIRTKVNLAKVHIVGHSLGSHVAGFIGKHIIATTGKKIGRITATDPGWPKFDHPRVDDSGKLTKNDAEFLEVIHTDSGHYGITSAIGHVDYYPNGGFFLQPGCPPIWEDDNCSHAKSNYYYIESIKYGNYSAVRCDNYLQYAIGFCNKNQKIVFGSYVDPKHYGTYQLNISV